MDPNCEEPICMSSPTGTKPKRNIDNLQNMLKKQNIETKNDSKGQSRLSDCPLNKETLGHYTWSFLHTMSVYYPEHPTQQQQKKMMHFLEGFTEFYPCKTCAAHFKGDINRIKPKLGSKKEFAIWMCDIHNETNRILGKKEFSCDYQNILNRWYKNPECQRSNIV